MTTIGPLHLGQRQRSCGRLAMEGSCSICGAGLKQATESRAAEAGAAAIGEKAEVSDAREALREQMQQEAAQEFIER